MNTKILIILIILVLVIGIILNFCMKKNNNEVTVRIDVISDYLEIPISENAVIEYQEEHDSFFHEGYTIMRIVDEGLLDKIEESPHWKDSSNEFTPQISEIKKSMENFYGEISEVNNYYWIYKNDYANPNSMKYIEQVKKQDVEITTHLVGIYDIDSGVLYYYHMDM